MLLAYGGDGWWPSMEELARGVAIFWALHGLWLLVALLSLRPLRPGPPVGDWTVLIAARNEADRIGETLRRLQGQSVRVAEGPSTDATRAIVDASDATLVPVDAVPEGWVGKSAALHAATHGVGTDWLVFLDADVHVAPDAVAAAVCTAETRGFDLLVVHPGQRCDTVWGRAAHHAVGLGMLIPSPPWMVQRGWATAGLGHFMVARRSVYEDAGGHAAIRSAILDDLALGGLMQQAGGIVGVASGTDAAESDWARSARDVVRATSKNAFAALGYRWWMVLAMSFGYGFMVLAAATEWWWGAGWATAAWSAHGGIALLQGLIRRGWGPSSRAGRRDGVWTAVLGALLSPLAWLVYAVAPVWSMVQTLRGGIAWRGTTYDWRRMS